MLSGWLVAVVAVAYLGLLFAVARFGDARADAGRSIISANVYSLSLAVYCTSWTFYGSVGRATSGGLSFLTIYLGPTLVFLLGTVIAKMIRISKAQRITSIADFIASRYGKSQFLAGLVTVIAVVGVVPYIALQLKAVSASFDIVVARPAAAGAPWWADSTLAIAAVMAVFTILFGTRHLDATERHEGMVAAVAFESVVKLAAFVAVGLFVTYGIFEGFGDVFRRAAASPELSRLLTLDSGRAGSWLALIILSGLAVLLLPRQFQIAVVENVDESHLRRAVWLFPLYLLLINIFVLPVALGGLLHFAGRSMDADTFVLTLPLSEGASALALLAFIGGLSAATGMVIVETIALSTMVCNDLVMPWLLRSAWIGSRRSDLSGVLLGIRRGAIALILFLGYVYFRAAGEAYALVAIGLISFAAVAQFAPALFGGMYWKQGNRAGAAAGLLGGFAVWTYTLLLPSFAKSGWIGRGFLDYGPAGIGALKAQALFGLVGLDEISHCLFWSFLVNAGLYVAVSLAVRPGATEVAQAERFVDALKRGGDGAVRASLWRGSASAGELVALLERFLGPSRAKQQLQAYALRRKAEDWASLPADADFVLFAETQLAGAIGSASARVMVASVVQEEELGLEEVLDILAEATQVRAYSRELEAKSRQLEAATAELREANERLRELDRMKDDFISTVTHELRTPLTSIRALSEMLFDDPRMALADRQRFFGVIVGEAERLTRLINQILDMAKLESGRAEWMTGEVNLADVVRESAGSVEQLFRGKGVTLDLSIPEAVPVVIADRDRLTQVMINLLSNAVKFVPAGEGRVGVSLSVLRDAARVEVADNGPGLRREELEVIFEKFRQGGNTLTDKPQGTGLGLPISRQIVEYFGGRLWAESEPGQGARFIFTIPLPANGPEHS